MIFSITQILLSTFLLFALSRVILRFKGGNVSVFGLVFWSLLFSSAVLFVLFPQITGAIAHWMGINRGVDAIIYTSIVILFYLVFRMYVNMQNMKHEITDLIKKIAIKDAEKNKK